MRRLCRSLAAALLAFTFAFPPQLWGWGNSGHESVAYVAWKKLTPATRTRVLVLLKLVPAITPPPKNGKQPPDIPGYKQWVKDLPAGLSTSNQNLYLFMRAATWADSIKHAGLNDSDNPPAVPSDVNIGFTDKDSHGYWHFIDTPFSSDHTGPTTTPSPNVVTQIIAFRTAIASAEDDKLKAYDLIFLEHLVGDVHQPLHATDRYVAGKDDTGGNGVAVTLPAAMKLTFEGTLEKQKKEYPKNLHAFWDDLPGEGAADLAEGQAATYAKALAAAPPTGVADTDPAHWAAESFALAQSDAYTSPIGASPAPTSGTSKSYPMTNAYYTKASKDAKARIALAGARLAKLIEDNLK